MHERYRRTSAAVLVGKRISAWSAKPPGATRSPITSAVLRAGCCVTASACVLDVQPEPKCIPEVFRPVEARSACGEVVVIEQRGRLADKREVVLGETVQDSERLGGRGARAIGAQQSSCGEPDPLATHRRAQSRLGKVQRTAGPAKVGLPQKRDKGRNLVIDPKPVLPERIVERVAKRPSGRRFRLSQE